jgi:phosphoribosylformylglycinamidine synthase
MSLSDADREIVVEEIGREPTRAESALFENLWSEHCAYRSSRPLLTAFDSEGEQVVIGPGDDAAVVSLPTYDGDEMYITMGIESHNHPSYVDPFDGAATGVGGIVRDTLSMGAYPIALADALYFGEFDREHSQYLFEGVVEGISHYGNCIGVPTVAGSVAFHEGYEGNPLVNVSCIGLLDPERTITAESQEPGNKLVLVGNATGRDGLGGASFASEDLGEDAETEDRPAVQVGDPYAEKLLIECNEALLDEDLVESARDLGAAGLGGAASELVAKGGLGAQIDLNAVHQREPNMNAMEILLAESQERMVYEVRPENVDRVTELADRYDLGASVIGELTESGTNFVCTFTDADGNQSRVVDVDAEFLGEGAPMNDLPAETPPTQERDLPTVNLSEAFERVLASPNTASKRWVYRQYDHEVGVRTSMRPGDDAAVLAIRESGTGLAFAAGADPNWTDAAPYEGAQAIALENATNVAAKGAVPHAAVDCLNGGNPEKPDVYGGFKGIVDGLAEMCDTLDVPVVGGNVSLYNDSNTGPIPPTPTLAVVGVKEGYDAPSMDLSGDGTLVVVGDLALDGAADPSLGGSEYTAQFGGTDRFPDLPSDPASLIETIAEVADESHVLASHDVSHGGLAVTLAEMVHAEAGATVDIETAERGTRKRLLFGEQPGRVVFETTDPDAVREAFDGIAPVTEIGAADASSDLDLTINGETLQYDAGEITALRSTIEDELE